MVMRKRGKSFEIDYYDETNKRTKKCFKTKQEAEYAMALVCLAKRGSILDKLEEKIIKFNKILPAVELPKYTGTTQTVYFLQAGQDGPIKIGFTNKPLSERISALNTASFKKLKLVKYIQNASKKIEMDLHDKFSHLRLNGEWFSPQLELINFIKNELSA